MPELSEADNDNDNDEFDWPIDPGTLEIKMEAETSEPRSKSRSKVWNYFERQVQFHSFFSFSVIENRYRHLAFFLFSLPLFANRSEFTIGLSLPLLSLNL